MVGRERSPHRRERRCRNCPIDLLGSGLPLASIF
jgi:hypothetical protein